jgi:hypothetical protein
MDKEDILAALRKLAAGFPNHPDVDRLADVLADMVASFEAAKPQAEPVKVRKRG